MTVDDGADWTVIYETVSASDADLVRTTLEVAGYQVSVTGAKPSSSFVPSYGTPAKLTIAVPAGDADDAREFLKEKTSLLDAARLDEPPAEDVKAVDVADVAADVLTIRREHEIAPCKYCGIATLDVSEIDLDSRMIAFLRAAGLGVNSATFSEYEPGERICSDCAGHEVTCEICARVLDAFFDEGEYRQANDDEAYVCSICRDRLEAELDATRDW